MANPEHLEILKQGVEVWSRWREQNPDVAPDLSRADLREADLSRANLSGAELMGANLSRANIREANLYWTILIDFDLLKEWELFESDTATDLAAEVRSYFIPDFSQWKNHDAYQKAFDRLMRDLKAEGTSGTD